MTNATPTPDREEIEIREILWQLRCGTFKPMAGTALADRVDKEIKTATDALQQLLIAAQSRTAKEIRAIFDMSEFDPTGTMMDKHMMARTPEEVAAGKQYNFDHAWAAMSAQGKIDKYIEEKRLVELGESKGEKWVI